jgi:hypothetical protein
MPVIFNTSTGTLGIVSEYCPDCGEPLYDTGCGADGCLGYRCNDCGTGCDVDLDEGGRCATALAEESDEDNAERVNAERAAFGLSPIQPEAAPAAAGTEPTDA